MLHSRLKSRFWSIMLVLVIIIGTPPTIASAITLPIRIVINYEKFMFTSGQPFEDSEKCIYAPLEFAEKELDANISYDSGTNKITVSILDKTAIFLVDSINYTINGSSKTLSKAFVLQDGIPYAPVMELCSAFGIDNEYEADINTIYIIDTAPITSYAFPNGNIDYFLHLEDGNLPGQLKSLRIELEQMFSLETVDEVISYAGQKTTYEHYLVEKYVYDSKSNRYIRVYGDNDQIGVVCSNTEFATYYNKEVNTKKATKVAGYYVPNTTDLEVSAKKNNGKTEACFRLNVDLKSYANGEQLHDLVTILLQKHSLEAVIDITSDFGSKDSSVDGLVDHRIYDSKTGKLLWIKASKRGSKYVDFYVCSDKWTKELTKNVKEENYEIISDFIVPQDTDLAAIPSDWGGTSDLWIALNKLGTDYPGQVSDMKAILLQKCDKSTVDKIAKYVLQKKNRWTHLAEKYFYDKKSKRYINVHESRQADVNVFFCSESYSKMISE